MAKETKKQELAVIDFTKFSVAQLPELKGKKEEIASVIEANPIVEIVDNSTYELAKKSRTAVKTLRTSLEKEQKDVKKKIKEHVLDVVDKEYDTIVLDVKSEEKSRQEPIDVWEEKKEQERQEKARLEQERIDGIKKKIGEFRQNWEDKISELTFDKIEDLKENYSVDAVEFDRKSLAEFDVLFEDSLNYLDNIFQSKIKTLAEQEQIRIDNLLIQEKNHENNRIQVWQNNWNSNISILEFENVSEIKQAFKDNKLANLKHYSTEYEEIYASTEKRLHSQIELISKAEEQRIAQEKFLKEKKEFEEKQLEAKFQERKKYLIELGMIDDGKERLIFEDSEFRYSQIREFDEPNWHESIEFLGQKISESKFPKEVEFGREFESEPISVGVIIGPTEVVSNVVDNTHEFADFKEEQEYIEQVTTTSKITWSTIYQEWENQNHPQKEESLTWLIWLETNYNVPTKKQ